jgi:hypothetical protein
MLYHSAVSTYYKAVRVGGEGSRGNVLREMTSRDRSELPKSFVPRERESSVYYKVTPRAPTKSNTRKPARLTIL